MKVLNENDTRSGLEAPVPLTHRRRPGPEISLQLLGNIPESDTFDLPLTIIYT